MCCGLWLSHSWPVLEARCLLLLFQSGFGGSLHSILYCKSVASYVGIYLASFSVVGDEVGLIIDMVESYVVLIGEAGLMTS